MTYNDQLGKHRFGAMAGCSMREEQWRMLQGKASNVPEGVDEYWYIKMVMRLEQPLLMTLFVIVAFLTLLA